MRGFSSILSQSCPRRILRNRLRSSKMVAMKPTSQGSSRWVTTMKISFLELPGMSLSMSQRAQSITKMWGARNLIRIPPALSNTEGLIHCRWLKIKCTSFLSSIARCSNSNSRWSIIRTSIKRGPRYRAKTSRVTSNLTRCLTRTRQIWINRCLWGTFKCNQPDKCSKIGFTSRQTLPICKISRTYSSHIRISWCYSSNSTRCSNRWCCSNRCNNRPRWGSRHRWWPQIRFNRYNNRDLR